MSQESSSPLFRIAMVSMVALIIGASIFKASPEEEQEDEARVEKATEARSHFRHAAPPEEVPPGWDDLDEVDMLTVARSLQRRALMERNGVVSGIIENPDMPEEIRSRFRAEKERLDKLASDYPQMADRSNERVPGAQRLAADGTYTKEFEDVVRQMKMSGTWDEINQSYQKQLLEAMNDPSIPADQRPTQAMVDEAAKQGLIALP